MTQGKLVVFAGGEGCGKSTCIKHLKKLLPQERFVFTREPGGTPTAEKVRDFFLQNELSAYEELLAVETARAIHFREKVIPALTAGKHVISDRCCEATWAYQVVGKNEEGNLKKLFNMLDHYSRLGRDIDLWIDFAIDVDTALSRRMNDGSEINIFDSRPLSYHLKVRNGLDEFFAQHESRVIKVDARLPEEELAILVHSTLCDFLGLAILSRTPL